MNNIIECKAIIDEYSLLHYIMNLCTSLQYWMSLWRHYIEDTKIAYDLLCEPQDEEYNSNDGLVIINNSQFTNHRPPFYCCGDYSTTFQSFTTPSLTPLVNSVESKEQK